MIGKKHLVGVRYIPGKELVELDVRFHESETVFVHLKDVVKQSDLTLNAVRSGRSEWSEEDIYQLTNCLPPRPELI